MTPEVIDSIKDEIIGQPRVELVCTYDYISPLQSENSIVDSVSSLFEACSIIDVQEKHIVINHSNLTEELISIIGYKLSEKEKLHIIDLISKSRPSKWNLKELVDVFGYDELFLRKLLLFDCQFELSSLHELEDKLLAIGVHEISSTIPIKIISQKFIHILKN